MPENEIGLALEFLEKFLWVCTFCDSLVYQCFKCVSITAGNGVSPHLKFDAR